VTAKVREISVQKTKLKNGKQCGILCIELDNGGVCISFDYECNAEEFSERLMRFGEDLRKLSKRVNG